MSTLHDLIECFEEAKWMIVVDGKNLSDFACDDVHEMNDLLEENGYDFICDDILLDEILAIKQAMGRSLFGNEAIINIVEVTVI